MLLEASLAATSGGSEMNTGGLLGLEKASVVATLRWVAEIVVDEFFVSPATDETSRVTRARLDDNDLILKVQNWLQTAAKEIGDES